MRLFQVDGTGSGGGGRRPTVDSQSPSLRPQNHPASANGATPPSRSAQNIQASGAVQDAGQHLGQLGSRAPAQMRPMTAQEVAQAQSPIHRSEFLKGLPKQIPGQAPSGSIRELFARLRQAHNPEAAQQLLRQIRSRLFPQTQNMASDRARLQHLNALTQFENIYARGMEPLEGQWRDLEHAVQWADARELETRIQTQGRERVNQVWQAHLLYRACGEVAEANRVLDQLIRYVREYRPPVPSSPHEQLSEGDRHAILVRAIEAKIEMRQAENLGFAMQDLQNQIQGLHQQGSVESRWEAHALLVQYARLHRSIQRHFSPEVVNVLMLTNPIRNSQTTHSSFPAWMDLTRMTSELESLARQENNLAARSAHSFQLAQAHFQRGDEVSTLSLLGEAENVLRQAHQPEELIRAMMVHQYHECGLGQHLNARIEGWLRSDEQRLRGMNPRQRFEVYVSWTGLASALYENHQEAVAQRVFQTLQNQMGRYTLATQAQVYHQILSNLVSNGTTPPEALRNNILSALRVGLQNSHATWRDHISIREVMIRHSSDASEIAASVQDLRSILSSRNLTDEENLQLRNLMVRGLLRQRELTHENRWGPLTSGTQGLRTLLAEYRSDLQAAQESLREGSSLTGNPEALNMLNRHYQELMQLVHETDDGFFNDDVRERLNFAQGIPVAERRGMEGVRTLYQEYQDFLSALPAESRVTSIRGMTQTLIERGEYQRIQDVFLPMFAQSLQGMQPEQRLQALVSMAPLMSDLRTRLDLAIERSRPRYVDQRDEDHEQLQRLRQSIVGQEVALWNQLRDAAGTPAAVKAFCNGMVQMAEGHPESARSIFQNILMDGNFRNIQDPQTQGVLRLAYAAIGGDVQDRTTRILELVDGLASARQATWLQEGHTGELAAIQRMRAELPRFLSTLPYDQLPATFEEALNRFAAVDAEHRQWVDEFSGALSRLPRRFEGSNVQRTGSVWNLIRAMDHLENPAQVRNALNALRGVLHDDVSWNVMSHEGRGDLGFALQDIALMLVQRTPASETQLRQDIFNLRNEIPEAEEWGTWTRETFNARTAMEVAMMALAGYGATFVAEAALARIFAGGVRLAEGVGAEMFMAQRSSTLAARAALQRAGIGLGDAQLEAMLAETLGARVMDRMAFQAVKGIIHSTAFNLYNSPSTLMFTDMSPHIVRASADMAIDTAINDAMFGQALQALPVFRSMHGTVLMSLFRHAMSNTTFLMAQNIRHQVTLAGFQTFSSHYQELQNERQRLQRLFEQTGNSEYQQRMQRIDAEISESVGEVDNSIRGWLGNYVRFVGQEVAERHMGIHAHAPAGEDPAVTAQRRERITDDLLRRRTRGEADHYIERPEVRDRVEVEIRARYEEGSSEHVRLRERAEREIEREMAAEAERPAAGTYRGMDREALRRSRVEERTRLLVEAERNVYRRERLQTERESFVSRHPDRNREALFFHALAEQGVFERYAPSQVQAILGHADHVFPPRTSTEAPGALSRSEVNRNYVQQLFERLSPEVLNRHYMNPAEALRSAQATADLLYPPSAAGERFRENSGIFDHLIQHTAPELLRESEGFVESVRQAREILQDPTLRAQNPEFTPDQMLMILLSSSLRVANGENAGALESPAELARALASRNIVLANRAPTEMRPLVPLILQSGDALSALAFFRVERVVAVRANQPRVRSEVKGARREGLASLTPHSSPLTSPDVHFGLNAPQVRGEGLAPHEVQQSGARTAEEARSEQEREVLGFEAGGVQADAQGSGGEREGREGNGGREESQLGNLGNPSEAATRMNIFGEMNNAVDNPTLHQTEGMLPGRLERQMRGQGIDTGVSVESGGSVGRATISRTFARTMTSSEGIPHPYTVHTVAPESLRSPGNMAVIGRREGREVRIRVESAMPSTEQQGALVMTFALEEAGKQGKATIILRPGSPNTLEVFSVETQAGGLPPGAGTVFLNWAALQAASQGQNFRIARITNPKTIIIALRSGLFAPGSQLSGVFVPPVTPMTTPFSLPVNAEHLPNRLREEHVPRLFKDAQGRGGAVDITMEGRPNPALLESELQAVSSSARASSHGLQDTLPPPAAPESSQPLRVRPEGWGAQNRHYELYSLQDNIPAELQNQQRVQVVSVAGDGTISIVGLRDRRVLRIQLPEGHAEIREGDFFEMGERALEHGRANGPGDNTAFASPHMMDEHIPGLDHPDSMNPNQRHIDRLEGRTGMPSIDNGQRAGGGEVGAQHAAAVQGTEPVSERALVEAAQAAPTEARSPQESALNAGSQIFASAQASGRAAQLLMRILPVWTVVTFLTGRGLSFSQVQRIFVALGIRLAQIANDKRMPAFTPPQAAPVFENIWGGAFRDARVQAPLPAPTANERSLASVLESQVFALRGTALLRSLQRAAQSEQGRRGLEVLKNPEVINRLTQALRAAQIGHPQRLALILIEQILGSAQNPEHAIEMLAEYELCIGAVREDIGAWALDMARRARTQDGYKDHLIKHLPSEQGIADLLADHYLESIVFNGESIQDAVRIARDMRAGRLVITSNYRSKVDRVIFGARPAENLAPEHAKNRVFRLLMMEPLPTLTFSDQLVFARRVFNTLDVAEIENFRSSMAASNSLALLSSPSFQVMMERTVANADTSWMDHLHRAREHLESSHASLQERERVLEMALNLLPGFLANPQLLGNPRALQDMSTLVRYVFEARPMLLVEMFELLPYLHPAGGEAAFWRTIIEGKILEENSSFKSELQRALDSVGAAFAGPETIDTGVRQVSETPASGQERTGIRVETPEQEAARLRNEQAEREAGDDVNAQHAEPVRAGQRAARRRGERGFVELSAGAAAMAFVGVAGVISRATHQDISTVAIELGAGMMMVAGVFANIRSLWSRFLEATSFRRAPRIENQLPPPGAPPPGQVRASQAAPVNLDQVQRNTLDGRRAVPLEQSGLPVRNGEIGPEVNLALLGFSDSYGVDPTWHTPHVENHGGISAISHYGMSRRKYSSNEDRYLIRTRANGSTLSVAIDGVGGYGGGERTAEIARVVIGRALDLGHSPEAALSLAHQVIRRENLRGWEEDYHRHLGTLNPHTGQLHTPDEAYAQIRQQLKDLNSGVPDAVVSIVENIPNPDGTYRTRYIICGDCEAAAFDFSQADPLVFHTTAPGPYAQARGRYALTPDGRLLRGQTLRYRMDPQANVVESTLGVRAQMDVFEPTGSTRAGTLQINGSDGWFECFGDFDVIAEILRPLSDRPTAEISQRLLGEALLRQSLLENLNGAPRYLDRNFYREQYRRVFGSDASPEWNGMYEAAIVRRPLRDDQGRLQFNSDGSLIWREHQGPFVLRPNGAVQDANGNTIDHFKLDNVTLVVQRVGEAIAPRMGGPQTSIRAPRDRQATVFEPDPLGAHVGGDEAATLPLPNHRPRHPSPVQGPDATMLTPPPRHSRKPQRGFATPEVMGVAALGTLGFSVMPRLMTMVAQQSMGTSNLALAGALTLMGVGAALFVHLLRGNRASAAGNEVAVRPAPAGSESSPIHPSAEGSESMLSPERPVYWLNHPNFAGTARILAGRLMDSPSNPQREVLFQEWRNLFERASERVGEALASGQVLSPEFQAARQILERLNEAIRNPTIRQETLDHEIMQCIQQMTALREYFAEEPVFPLIHQTQAASSTDMPNHVREVREHRLRDIRRDPRVIDLLNRTGSEASRVLNERVRNGRYALVEQAIRFLEAEISQRNPASQENSTPPRVLEIRENRLREIRRHPRVEALLNTAGSEASRVLNERVRNGRYASVDQAIRFLETEVARRFPEEIIARSGLNPEEVAQRNQRAAEEEVLEIEPIAEEEILEIEPLPDAAPLPQAARTTASPAPELAQAARAAHPLDAVVNAPNASPTMPERVMVQAPPPGYGPQASRIISTQGIHDWSFGHLQGGGVIGRDTAVFADPAVANQHCVVERVPDGSLYLQSVDAHPTYLVNPFGELISVPPGGVRVYPGQLIQIGQTRLRLVTEGRATDVFMGDGLAAPPSGTVNGEGEIFTPTLPTLFQPAMGVFDSLHQSEIPRQEHERQDSSYAQADVFLAADGQWYLRNQSVPERVVVYVAPEGTALGNMMEQGREIPANSYVSLQHGQVIMIRTSQGAISFVKFQDPRLAGQAASRAAVAEPVQIDGIDPSQVVLHRQFQVAQLPIDLENSGLPTRRNPAGALEIDLPALGMDENWRTDSHWNEPGSESYGAVHAFSHRGIGGKDHNEDRYAVVRCLDGRNVLLVLDGMGGHAGAERAAEMVRRVVQRALEQGQSLEHALALAHGALRQDAQRRDALNPVGDVVAMAVELRPAHYFWDPSSPHAQELPVRFIANGDSEALVLDLHQEDPVLFHSSRPRQESRGAPALQVRRDASGRALRGQTMVIRQDPHANVVNHGVKSDGHFEVDQPRQPLRPGQLILAGCDGFFENYGSHDRIVDVLRARGVTDQVQALAVLREDVLVRQALLHLASESGGPLEITEALYQRAYALAFPGQTLPAEYHQTYSQSTQRHVRRDENGQLQRNADGSLLYDEHAGPFYIFPEGDVRSSRGVAVDHFKIDNVTLLVQEVGRQVLSEPLRETQVGGPLAPQPMMQNWAQAAHTDANSLDAPAATGPRMPDFRPGGGVSQISLESHEPGIPREEGLLPDPSARFTEPFSSIARPNPGGVIGGESLPAQGAARTAQNPLEPRSVEPLLQTSENFVATGDLEGRFPGTRLPTAQSVSSEGRDLWRAQGLVASQAWVDAYRQSTANHSIPDRQVIPTGMFFALSHGALVTAVHDLLRRKGGHPENLTFLHAAEQVKYFRPARAGEALTVDIEMVGDGNGVHIENGVPNSRSVLKVKRVFRNANGEVVAECVSTFQFRPNDQVFANPVRDLPSETSARNAGAVDIEQINRFAEVSGDHQWLHDANAVTARGARNPYLHGMATFNMAERSLPGEASFPFEVNASFSLPLVLGDQVTFENEGAENPVLVLKVAGLERAVGRMVRKTIETSPSVEAARTAHNPLDANHPPLRIRDLLGNRAGVPAAPARAPSNRSNGRSALEGVRHFCNTVEQRLIARNASPALRGDFAALKARIEAVAPGDIATIKDLNKALRTFSQRVERQTENNLNDGIRNSMDLLQDPAHCKEGVAILSPEQRTLIESHLRSRHEAVIIAEAMNAIVAQATKNHLKAYGQLLGLLFELSRIRIAEERGFSFGDLLPGITRFRYATGEVDSNTGRPIEREISNDVGVVPWTIWEVKAYHFNRYGDANSRQQLLNYERLIGDPVYRRQFGVADYGVGVVEVSGIVHPDLLRWAQTNCPHIEFLYTFRISETHELSFALNEAMPFDAATPRPSLRRVHPSTALSAREQQILRGVHRLQREGRLVPEVLSQRLLTAEDVERSDLSPEHKAELLGMLENGRVNPRTCRSIPLLQEYLRLVERKRQQIFFEAGAAVAPETNVDYLWQGFFDQAEVRRRAEENGVRVENPREEPANRVSEEEVDLAFRATIPSMPAVRAPRSPELAAWYASEVEPILSSDRTPHEKANAIVFLIRESRSAPSWEQCREAMDAIRHIPGLDENERIVSLTDVVMQESVPVSVVQEFLDHVDQNPRLSPRAYAEAHYMVQANHPAYRRQRVMEVYGEYRSAFVDDPLMMQALDSWEHSEPRAGSLYNHILLQLVREEMLTRGMPVDVSWLQTDLGFTMFEAYPYQRVPVEVLRDFARALVDFKRADRYNPRDPLMPFLQIPVSGHVHFFLGRRPNLTDTLRSITENFATYPRVFGALAGPLFEDRVRLRSRMDTPEGPVYLQIARGRYEYNTGIEMSITGTDELLRPDAFFAKAGIHLQNQEDGSVVLQVVNIQGPYRDEKGPHAMEHEARQALLGETNATRVLMANVLLLAENLRTRGVNVGRIEIIHAEAQMGYQDQLRNNPLREDQRRMAPYTELARRFGFQTRRGHQDFSSLDVTALSRQDIIHRINEALGDECAETFWTTIAPAFEQMATVRGARTGGSVRSCEPAFHTRETAAIHREALAELRRRRVEQEAQVRHHANETHQRSIEQAQSAAIRTRNWLLAHPNENTYRTIVALGRIQNPDSSTAHDFHQFVETRLRAEGYTVERRGENEDCELHISREGTEVAVLRRRFAAEDGLRRMTWVSHRGDAEVSHRVLEIEAEFSRERQMYVDASFTRRPQERELFERHYPGAMTGLPRERAFALAGTSLLRRGSPPLPQTSRPSPARRANEEAGLPMAARTSHPLDASQGPVLDLNPADLSVEGATNVVTSAPNQRRRAGVFTAGALVLLGAIARLTEAFSANASSYTASHPATEHTTIPTQPSPSAGNRTLDVTSFTNLSLEQNQQYSLALGRREISQVSVHADGILQVRDQGAFRTWIQRAQERHFDRPVPGVECNLREGDVLVLGASPQDGNAQRFEVRRVDGVWSLLRILSSNTSPTSQTEPSRTPTHRH